MKHFNRTLMKAFFCLFFISSMISGCASQQNIDARRGGIIKTSADLRREDVKDYMTYLKLKKGASPLDQDYILLSYRVIKDMLLSDFFTNQPKRVKIALRDVLNYSSIETIRPEIIHEAVEKELMNSEQIWVVDGSVLYDYVLDVELAEVPLNQGQDTEKNALSVMFILSDVTGKNKGEWFDFLKRNKDGLSWY